MYLDWKPISVTPTTTSFPYPFGNVLSPAPVTLVNPDLATASNLPISMIYLFIYISILFIFLYDKVNYILKLRI